MSAEDNTLELFDLENLSSYGWIIGSVILIMAVNQSKKIFIETGRDADLYPSKGPDTTTLFARAIFIIAGIVAAVTATTRLNERKQKIIDGKPVQGSLIPNILTSTGLWICLLGIIIAGLGDLVRAEENTSPLPVE